MDNLIMTVKNICAFVLMITVVDNLLSSDVYKKYIRLFTGIVLIIMIIKPLYELPDAGKDIEEKIIQYVNECVDRGIASDTLDDMEKADFYVDDMLKEGCEENEER